MNYSLYLGINIMYYIFEYYRLMAEATMAIIHEGTVALDVMQVKVGYKCFNIL